MRCEHLLARGRVHDLVHQAQAGHRVLGVADRLRRKPARSCSRVNFSDSAAPPTSSGTCDAGVLAGRRAVITICCALFTSRPESPMASGLCSLVGLDQLLRRHLDAEVDHLVAVVAEDDLDQVLADVVDVALHRGEDDLAARGGVGLLHELLEVADGGLHRLGRLQHLGDDQLVVVEQPADLGHARHQRAVDDVERRGAFRALAVEIGDQAVLACLR